MNPTKACSPKIPTLISGRKDERVMGVKNNCSTDISGSDFISTNAPKINLNIPYASKVGPTFSPAPVRFCSGAGYSRNKTKPQVLEFFQNNYL